jgi:hypothetical protein
VRRFESCRGRPFFCGVTRTSPQGHRLARDLSRVERYGIPPDWPTAIKPASDDPARLVHAVHDAEATDPLGERWPRSKRHDDKAAVVLRFAPAA